MNGAIGYWGFSRKIGKANGFMGETWALRDGLLLCQHLKINAVIIELDAKALVDALNNPLFSNSVISPLFEDCEHLATQIPHVSIKHSYWEGNRCADRLASLGLGQAMNFVIHYCPHVDLIPLVKADCQGMVFNRLCPDIPYSS